MAFSLHTDVRGGEQKKKTLLSLHPTASGGVQFPQSTACGPSSSHSAGPAPWPSPEELLKESLRQSLSALHALGRIKSLVDNLPGSEDDENDGEEEGGGSGGGGAGGEKGIAQIMGFYDRAVGEMKAAGEVLVLGPQSSRTHSVRIRTNLVRWLRADVGSAVSV